MDAGHPPSNQRRRKLLIAATTAAGRVYRNVPAPANLVIPPHKYVTDARVLIGEDIR